MSAQAHTTEAVRDRRGLILDTTLSLIAEGGVDAVTHRRVAAAADVPLGSTTYYFNSREHLIRAAFNRYLESLRAMQQGIDVDPTQSTAHLVDFLVALTERGLNSATLQAEYEMTLFAARDKELAETLHAWYDSMSHEIASALEALGSSDAGEGAEAVLHMIRGHELERLTRSAPAADSLRARLTRIIDTYTNS